MSTDIGLRETLMTNSQKWNKPWCKVFILQCNNVTTTVQHLPLVYKVYQVACLRDHIFEWLFEETDATYIDSGVYTIAETYMSN